MGRGRQLAEKHDDPARRAVISEWDRWASRRLPTGYKATGDDEMRFFGRILIPQHDESNNQRLCDMLAGRAPNHWVEDCYHDSYRGAPSDGSAWTSEDRSRTKPLRLSSCFQSRRPASVNAVSRCCAARASAAWCSRWRARTVSYRGHEGLRCCDIAIIRQPILSLVAAGLDWTAASPRHGHFPTDPLWLFDPGFC